MDYYSLLMNPDEAKAKEEARAFEQAMGLREMIALAAAGGTDDKALGRLGQMLHQTAGQGRQAAQGAMGDRLRALLDKRRQDHQEKHQGATLEESTRHNKAMERLGGGRPSVQFLIGDGGAHMMVDPRTGRATPVVGPDGKPVKKPPTRPTTRPVPVGEKQDLLTQSETLREVKSLQGRFKDDFAGKGMLAGVKDWANSLAGSWGSEGMQNDAAFWADFKMFVDLPERHKKFGASLTPSEQRSWESAKNLNSKSDPRIVKAQFEKMARMLQEKVSDHGEALLEEGYKPAAVNKLTDGLVGTVEMKNAAGQTFQIPIDKVEEAEADPDEPLTRVE